MDQDRDAYRVLQVDVDALPAVIRAAYHALARLYHPDGTAPDAARMATINGAYELLRDPDRRRRYDRDRAVRRVATIPVVSEARPPADTWPSRGRRVDGSPILDFGRYTGWRISDLARHDADYLRWLARHSSGIRFRSAIASVLPPDPDLARTSKAFS